MSGADLVGGKILDAGALAAALDHNMVVASWLAMSRHVGLTLLIPEPAVTEVATIRPTAADRLALITQHPQIHVTATDTLTVADANKLLRRSARWDATAALVAVLARVRHWPVLSGDPERLTRIDPTITIKTIH